VHLLGWSNRGSILAQIGHARIGDGPTTKLGPCCEIQPHGEVSLPVFPVGERILELRYHQQLDRYRLNVSPTELTFAPISTCFSDGGGADERPRTRIPLGAFYVSCYDNISTPDAGSGCAAFYAEPYLQSLPRLLPAPGGWAQRGLERDTPVFSSGDLAEVRRLLARYPAAKSPIRITVTPAGASSFGN
jgi:hypothetical protein